MIQTLLIYCACVDRNYKLYKIHGTYNNILVISSKNNVIINTTSLTSKLAETCSG